MLKILKFHKNYKLIDIKKNKIKNTSKRKYQKIKYGALFKERKNSQKLFIRCFILILLIISLLFFTYYYIYKRDSNEKLEYFTEEKIYKKKDIYHNLSMGKEIKLDNKIDLIFYEYDIDFSKYSTDVKAIAIYLPNFYPINNISSLGSDNEDEYNSLNFLKNIKPKNKLHHQPRVPDYQNYIKNYNLAENLVIKKQIELAQKHGIHGFAIYYYWFSGKTIFNRPLNIIYNNKNSFHYMIIWKNENVTDENNRILLEEKYEERDPEIFINDIEKYLRDKLYIRNNERPIIGIYNINKIPKLRETIETWRKKAIDCGIGEIFIISSINGKNTSEVNDMKIFNGIYKLPPNDIPEKKFLKNYRVYNNFIYYYGLLKRISEINSENFTVYKSSVVEWDNSPISKNPNIFGEYSPEIFYLMNKLIINWTKENYEQSNRFIFINAWNNYYEGTYLEPDEKYGFASINAFSKALFNLSYILVKYNISNLMNTCLTAVHAHIFYENFNEEIINKTNNIPVKFDLYITTDTIKKMEYIKNYTDLFSKANNVSIKVIENKGRDILGFLIQMREVVDKYKYICHIHTKKSLHNLEFGKRWRTHLYERLLGSSEVISEILSDFENYDKLGIIYPENFHDVIPHTIYISRGDKEKMDFMIDKLFPGNGYKIRNKFFDFPAGNMFWVRTKAIYQIFQIDLEQYINGSVNQNILFAIERLWLFIAKLNGYYYKKSYNY